MSEVMMRVAGELVECKIRGQRSIYSEGTEGLIWLNWQIIQTRAVPTVNQIQQAVTYRPVCEDKILVILRLQDQRYLIGIKCSTTKETQSNDKYKLSKERCS